MTDPINDKMLFDRKKVGELKKAYEDAVMAGKKSFKFEGREILVAYAKYLIEYLEQHLKNMP